jgi:hypothetical protein
MLLGGFGAAMAAFAKKLATENRPALPLARLLAHAA